MKYIHRYDIEKQNHVWYVVIELYATSRYFSDQAYGGKEDSFLAALTFRNQELTRYLLLKESFIQESGPTIPPVERASVYQDRIITLIFL